METTRGSASSGERLALLRRPLQTLDYFGLIRSMVPSISSEGTIRGAPFYTAPGLAPGDDLNGGTYLYRCYLGTLSYQLTNRRLSFNGDHHYPLPEHARAAGHGLPQSSPRPQHARPEGAVAKE